MLTIFDNFSSSQYGRRELLRIGASTLGALALPSLLSAKSRFAGIVKDRSVVFLNFQGGPTQFETFDPKMSAPREIRSITGETPTSLPGITFGGTLPRLAKLAHHMAVVRSYQHGISDHGRAAKHVMAGGNKTGAMMGALFADIVGLTNDQSGLPQNALVTPRVFGDDFKKLYASVDRVSETGSLSSIYKPFDPSSGGEILNNMTLNLNGDQLDNRKQLLRQFDGLKRSVYESDIYRAADGFQKQAFDVLSRGVAKAFDISTERESVVRRYDTSHCIPTDGVQARNSYAAQFSPIALGKQLLLARRLCENGCGFVTVTCGGWDMHGGGKEFTMVDGLATLLPAVDKAVSAFIEDVHARGLTDKILLVMTGEFGRTPRINKNGGRDHWGNLCPIVFVGGGLRMGQVIGKSDKTASRPASAPITSQQVLATVMHSLFDIGQLRLVSGIPTDTMDVVTGGTPIEELF